MVRTCGEKVFTDRRERVARIVEEAIELAQDEGLTAEVVGRILEHVYGRATGKPAQEVGGIGVTLLAYCASAGISADREEARELDRVLARSAQHFQERQRR